ncbi:MAG TPA: hypothetical protein VFQ07_07070 [Candidatus Polarisedimenticolia bacterium]|nr:hypothetical protein [Candidatus Polarisedimenticolia bacterium]
MRFRFELKDALKVLPALAFGWVSLTFFRALLPVSAAPAPSSGHLLRNALQLVLGIGLLGYGFVLLHRKRAIDAVPRSRLRSVAMGFAEVSGVARMRTSVMAPYSGIPCVTCRFLAEEEDDDRRGGWRTIESGQSPDWFILDDGTATIVVDPDGADLVLGRDYRTIERAEGWFGRRRRYTEWRLHPGETACVVGTVRRVRSLAFEQRTALHDRLRAIKQDPARLASFDSNRDGRIDTEEWGNAVRVARQEVAREAVAAEAPRPVDELILGKGAGEKTFVITDRTERDLVRSLAWKAGLALLSGAWLAGAGAHALLQRIP